MNFLKNLPIELEQLIYSYDDTYKPTMNPENEINWCEIQSHVIDKARRFWYRKDPSNARKYLFDWYKEPTEDDFDVIDWDTDSETDDEE